MRTTDQTSLLTHLMVVIVGAWILLQGDTDALDMAMSAARIENAAANGSQSVARFAEQMNVPTNLGAFAERQQPTDIRGAISEQLARLNGLSQAQQILPAELQAQPQAQLQAQPQAQRPAAPLMYELSSGVELRPLWRDGLFVGNDEVGWMRCEWIFNGFYEGPEEHRAWAETFKPFLVDTWNVCSSNGW